MAVMDEPSYRSYVIRAWRSGRGDDARARIRIERVELGEQVDLEGSAATRLAASIEAAIDAASNALSAGDPAERSAGPGATAGASSIP